MSSAWWERWCRAASASRPIEAHLRLICALRVGASIVAISSRFSALALVHMSLHLLGDSGHVLVRPWSGCICGSPLRLPRLFIGMSIVAGCCDFQLCFLLLTCLSSHHGAVGFPPHCDGCSSALLSLTCLPACLLSFSFSRGVRHLSGIHDMTSMPGVPVFFPSLWSWCCGDG